MSTRLARLLVLALIGLYVGLVTTGLTLQAFSGTSVATLTGIQILMQYLSRVIGGLLVAIGALIVWRHPRHPVGWLLCAGLIIPNIDLLGIGYVNYRLMTSLGLPTPVLVWGNLTGIPFGMSVFTFMFLLSPDGRLPSRRWRPVAWIATGAAVLYISLKAVQPGPVKLLSLVLGLPSLDNPLGVNPAAWVFLNPLMLIALASLTACNWAGFVSLIVRLRRGRGIEHHQVKWLIFPACLVAVGVPLVSFGEYDPSGMLFSIGGNIHIVAVPGLAIATAIAILRYRLYDIDLIINRTLVYGALTGTLGLAYLLSVVLLQRIFPAESQIAIVLSTLAIVVLFTPLRRRIQDAIDRRFYRRRYDTERAIAAFSVAVREQVDLEGISHSLLAIVEDTVQPARISLWLRER